jgi:hypothetical protein
MELRPCWNALGDPVRVAVHRSRGLRLAFSWSEGLPLASLLPLIIRTTRRLFSPGVGGKPVVWPGLAAALSVCSYVATAPSRVCQFVTSCDVWPRALSVHPANTIQGLHVPESLEPRRASTGGPLLNSFGCRPYKDSITPRSINLPVPPPFTSCAIDRRISSRSVSPSHISALSSTSLQRWKTPLDAVSTVPVCSTLSSLTPPQVFQFPPTLQRHVHRIPTM